MALMILESFLKMHHATLQNMQNAFADARFLFLLSSDFTKRICKQIFGENACLFLMKLAMKPDIARFSSPNYS